MTPKSAQRPPLPPLLAGYTPPAGVSDELLDAKGQVRHEWTDFLRYFSGLTPEDIANCFARGDQYLHDAGVFFRQYDSEGSTERAWPLSHIPVLIDDTEWQNIARGLIQRADVLERMMADFYGPNQLVADGHLPPALLADNPEWLRPLVGVKPRGGHYLHFVAFEIGRGPDDTWWVLGDRTQAPSGAGFALENRVATARAFADMYAQSNVHRLAGFFRAFRDGLQSLRTESDSPVGILTPGPLNETYFEHAWIARYLGFSLLQGEDLAVSGGQMMLRTVSGLKPISVLWRRLDGGYADPLELDPASRLGTPGMVTALRAGGLTMVNALGSGVLETRALMAFLPRIAQALTGEKLLLPNIATWWCGQKKERRHVEAHASRMVISSALTTRQPFDDDQGARRGSSIPAEDLAAWLDAEGANLVGQESVTLSTTPAFVGGRLVPRPMSLRVFLARTPQGWRVMPGGFARIGGTSDPTAIAMQRGGSAADVWIVSRTPVEDVTMIPSSGAPYRRAAEGALPARAADNLFWLGRYVERTEGVLRLLRARNVRLAESGAKHAAPLLEAIGPLFKAQGVDPDQGIPDGLLNILGGAVASAGQVRDRFSPDGWSALNDMHKTARRMATRVSLGDDAARAQSALLRKLTGFSGLVHENMYRFTGWRFLELGRFHERAMTMAALLATLADPKAPEGALDLLVEVGDSVMSHRRRFALSTTRETVIDLLGLDSMNPRALLYQLDGMRDQIALLPGAAPEGQLSDLSRAMLRTYSRLATETPETLKTKALWEIRGSIAALSDLLTESYLR